MRELAGIDGPVTRLAFAPDGRTLLVDGERRLTAHDTGGGPVRVLTDRSKRFLSCDLTVSPDGRFVVVGEHEADVAVIDLANGACRQWDAWDAWESSLDSYDPVRSAWAPDGRWLAVAWRHKFSVLTFGPEGPLSDTGTLGQVSAERPCAGVAWEPGGAWLAVVRRSVPEWPMVGVGFWSPTGDAPEPFEWPRETHDFGADIAADASLVAIRPVWDPNGLGSPRPPGTLEVWDVRERCRRFTIADVPATLGAVAFSPGGRWLAAGDDECVCVWDAATGRLRARYDWGVPSPRAVAFAPDGLTMAAGGSDGRVVVWDVEA